MMVGCGEWDGPFDWARIVVLVIAALIKYIFFD